MTERLPSPQLLLRVHALRDRALAADSLNALAFSMANDAYALLQYHQALVFAQQGDQPELLCVSGLAKPAEDSPYLVGCSALPAGSRSSWRVTSPSGWRAAL